MSKFLKMGAGTALLAFGLSACATAPQTAPNYRFEAVNPQVQHSANAEVPFRLVHLPDNRPVTGAVIYDHRFEMWMSGYKIATSRMVEGREIPASLAVEQGNGIYLVHSDLPMPGEWYATLTARVPGEALPVRSTVTLKAR